jgi:hypothetical protein
LREHTANRRPFKQFQSPFHLSFSALRPSWPGRQSNWIIQPSRLGWKASMLFGLPPFHGFLERGLFADGEITQVVDMQPTDLNWSG